MEVALAAAVTLGVSGSLHCLGMCGPLVAAMPARPKFAAAAGGRLAYHTGRIGVYSLLGTVAGLIGGTAEFFNAMGALSVLCGVVVIGFAFGADALANRFRLFAPLGMLHTAVRRLFAAVSGRKSFVAQAGAGIANGFLPCGLTFAAMAGAGAMRSPGEGALFMAAFGAGTLPAMLGISLISAVRLPRLRPFSRVLAPVGACIAGGLLIVRGVTAFAAADTPRHDSTHCAGEKIGIIAPR